jgi:hypothetical protein
MVLTGLPLERSMYAMEYDPLKVEAVGWVPARFEGTAWTFDEPILLSVRAHVIAAAVHQRAGALGGGKVAFDDLNGDGSRQVNADDSGRNSHATSLRAISVAPALSRICRTRVT